MSACQCARMLYDRGSALVCRYDPACALMPHPCATLHHPVALYLEVMSSLRRKRGEVELLDVVIDVAKSAERGPHCIAACPCLVPNSLPYRHLTQQIFTPLQVAALQGMYPEDFPCLELWAADVERARLLRDLVGNSFTTTVCLAVLVAVFANWG